MLALVRVKFTIIFIVMLLASISFCSAEEGKLQQVKQVLLLQSYYQGHSGEDEVTKSVKKTFNENHLNIRLTIEYMDTKRAKSELHFKNLIALYKEKFKHDKFDIIIANDDNALFFALDHRADLFSNAPIVFLGVSYYPAERLGDEKNVTGIVQNIEYKKTFELAFFMHPKMSQLIVINDRSSTGLKRTPQIKKALSELNTNIPLLFYDDLCLEELSTLLKEANRDSVLFLNLFNIGRNGETFSTAEILNLVNDNFKGPVYATKKAYLGGGIVGGYLSDSSIHGTRAAEMVLDILDDIKADDIPVIMKNVDLPAFDYPQLSKYRISEKALPQNSIIHNIPFSFFQKYKIYLFMVGTITTLLLFSTMILFLYIIMRRKGEQKLIHLQNYLINVFDSMPSVLVGVDIAGNVTQWNKKAEQLSGITLMEARGQPLNNVLQITDDWMDLIQKTIKTREIKTEHRKIQNKNLEEIYEDITIYPLVANGIEGAVIRIDDVTKKTRMEELLIQNEKMLSLGGLAAGMAHEINNPLAGIMQNAQVIVNRLEKDSPANTKLAEELGLDLTLMRNFLTDRKIFNQLERIRQAGTRATEIVSNMLGFARKEQSKSSHNIIALLNKTLVMAESDYSLKKNYDFRNIEIIRKYEENIPMVICNPGQIQQVFFNLLKNGAEAMYEVKTNNKAQFTLIASQTDKNVKIVIQNNLCGIPKEQQGKIFDPFFTTKPTGEGTGLGLSVSYFIINENHNGSLSVESDGTSWVKFIIELPLER